MPKNKTKINDLYQYILGEWRTIDLSKVPPANRELKKEMEKNKRKEFFKSITEDPDLSPSLRQLLRQNQSHELEDILYGDHEQPLPSLDLIIPADEEIQKKFLELNKQHQNFPENDTSYQQKFLKLYKICALICILIEKFKMNNDLIVYEILTQLNDKNFSDIQTYLMQNKENIDLTEEAHQVLPNAEEFLEFAKLCVKHFIPENAQSCFAQGLEIRKKQKTVDLLPNVVIDGAKCKHPGYYLVKVPIGDPIAYLMGKMTNCCMYITFMGVKCNIDVITNPHSTFYVLIKSKFKQKKHPPIHNEKGAIDCNNYTVVGGGYAWLSQHHNLTFDSWENKHYKTNAISIDMLNLFAREIISQENSIFRVTVGTGTKTPNLNWTKLRSPENPLDSYTYKDEASEQFLIGFDERRIQSFCDWIKLLYGTTIQPKELDIYSYEQLEKIEAILKHKDHIMHLQTESKYDLSAFIIHVMENINEYFDEVSFLSMLPSDLVTQKNISILKKHNMITSSENKILIEALRSLARLNLATQENFELCLTHESHLEIAKAILYLQNKKPTLLTQENLQKLSNRVVARDALMAVEQWVKKVEKQEKKALEKKQDLNLFGGNASTVTSLDTPSSQSQKNVK